MKINFANIEVQTSFEGARQAFNTTKTLGNDMMYNSSILLDIGFEDLAKQIYYSEGEVEIPDRYRNAIIEVVRQSTFISAIKREIINQLNKKEEKQ